MTHHKAPPGPPRDPFQSDMGPPDPDEIQRLVQTTLQEDLGPEDVSAALVPSGQRAQAQLLLREPAIVCGQPWFDACFRALDPGAEVRWHVAEGQRADTPGVVAEVSGLARAILSAERSALNLLQTLSGTATQTADLVALLQGTGTRLLDTRKTLPGLRSAQKYAVRTGGGWNHRLGLWDAVLIKENHILACGSIRAAIERARAAGKGRWIEVETENLDEVEQALNGGAEVIMLDDFTLDDLALAVQRIRGRAISEASGNVTPESLPRIAATRVDYVSAGSITKHLRAVDFSLRLV